VAVFDKSNRNHKMATTHSMYRWSTDEKKNPIQTQDCLFHYYINKKRETEALSDYWTTTKKKLWHMIDNIDSKEVMAAGEKHSQILTHE